MHEYELKRLSTDDLESAIQMAMNYRDLNLPQEAESICRDVLDVAPTHEDAIRILGLALTDRLTENQVGIFEEARATFAKMPKEYDRVYYDGVAWERMAKADLLKNEGHNALAALEHALEAFDKAQQLATDPSPDPILRWNRCVRLLHSHPLLKDAFDAPHSRQPHLGD
jgi:tetratricopeptide (TPR) repeat protein